MKTFNYFLLLACISLLCISCAHCSKTVTHFDGKTKSLNPYGDGVMVVDRESYWGDKTCVKRFLDK